MLCGQTHRGKLPAPSDIPSSIDYCEVCEPRPGKLLSAFKSLGHHGRSWKMVQLKSLLIASENFLQLLFYLVHSKRKWVEYQDLLCNEPQKIHSSEKRGTLGVFYSPEITKHQKKITKS